MCSPSVVEQVTPRVQDGVARDEEPPSEKPDETIQLDADSNWKPAIVPYSIRRQQETAQSHVADDGAEYDEGEGHDEQIETAIGVPVYRAFAQLEVCHTPQMYALATGVGRGGRRAGLTLLTHQPYSN